MSALWTIRMLSAVLGVAIMIRSPSREALLHWAAPGQDRPQAQGAHSPPLEVIRDVEAFLGHYIETLEGKDEAAIKKLFVADERFAWFTDGAKSYSTPDGVLAGMQRYAGTTFKTTLSEVNVVPLGAALASARSSFRTKLTIPGADDYEFGGVITWLIEKSPSSDDWRVLLGHTSTPGGPPRGDEEKK